MGREYLLTPYQVLADTVLQRSAASHGCLEEPVLELSDSFRPLLCLRLRTGGLWELVLVHLCRPSTPSVEATRTLLPCLFVLPNCKGGKGESPVFWRNYLETREGAHLFYIQMDQGLQESSGTLWSLFFSFFFLIICFFVFGCTGLLLLSFGLRWAGAAPCCSTWA